MKTATETNLGVPLGIVSVEKTARASRSIGVAVVTAPPVSVMGNRTFMRAWAARRAQTKVIRVK